MVGTKPVRALLLTLFAACWIAPVEEPALAPPPAKPHAWRKQPRCWSTELHNEMPHTFFGMRECMPLSQQPDDYWYCMFQHLNTAYDALEKWIVHWFEVCDPMELR